MDSLNYFNEIAPKWNQMREEYFDDAIKQKVISQIVEGKTVGDFGAGTGFLSLALAEKANLVFALDQSKNMLSELVKASKRAKLNRVFPIIGTFEQVPIYDESLDHAFTNMALHHVGNPLKALEEIYRTLKPGGMVHITDVEKHDGLWAIEEMHDIWLGFTHQQMYEWLKEVGFDNVKVENTGLHCQGVSSRGVFTRTGVFLAEARKPSNGFAKE